MKQIVPGFYQLTYPIGINMYLIEDPDGFTLIDTSVEPAGKWVVNVIQKMGGKTLKRILITHAHPDHVGGLPHLKSATGAEVIASVQEKDVIEGKISVPRRPKGLSMPETWVKTSQVDRVVGDGDTLTDVWGGMQVCFTPGHAPGHLAFWHPERKVLIAGDVLFNVFGLTLPPGPLTVDMEEDKRSVGKLAALQPDVLALGHGSVITHGTANRLRTLAQKLGTLPA